MTLSVAEAAAKIRSGGVVAFPTETVFGLGANALDADAVSKIFALKGRPSTIPLIVHVASIDAAKRLVSEWPPLAQELAERWWPGPLTLVLKKHPIVPDVVTAGLPTVGLRIPNHPVALELLNAAGVPIAPPSANKFTELSPTTAEHVRKAFGDEIDLVGGDPSSVGIESTVVALEDGKLKLLRPGMISFGEIERAAAKPDAAHPAPGMHEKHYSPRTPLLLVKDRNALPGREGAYLWHGSSGLTARSVRMPSDPAAYGAKLYRVLHELDTGAWPWIAVEVPPAKPEWDAIRDRLERAAKR